MSIITIIKQLKEPLSLLTPKWEGQALFLYDYGLENDSYFMVAIDSTGELWIYPTNQCRTTKNITINRNNISEIK